MWTCTTESWNGEDFRMIKAIFFDMDGTLLSHNQKKIPDSTMESLWDLKQQGIKVVVTTGRHMSELEELSLLDFPYDGFITVNGSICLDENKELFYIHPIEGADKKTILDMFARKEIPVILVEQNDMYINFVNENVRKTQADISTAVPPVKSYECKDIVMACVYLKEESENALNVFENLTITRWNKRAVDVIPSDSGKTKGIKKFLEKYQIGQEETMAFGDAANDMDMLQFCHIGVAMGNGSDKIKAVADHVTDDVDSDGIRNALCYFGIIEPRI